MSSSIPDMAAGKSGPSDALMAVPRLSSVRPLSTATRKRKHTQEDTDSSSHSFANQSPSRGGLNKPHLQLHHRRPSLGSRYKRTKTTRIHGQSLPVNRMLEVMDHKSLQKMLKELVAVHPEIQETINRLSPAPVLENSVKLLQEKLDDMLAHLPYKCDIESDYSYLRVKSLLMEFFNCLSDLILAYLPPAETNMEKSLRFLHEATEMVHSLPNFSNSEFQYTKNMAYEQVANTWLVVLQQDELPGNTLANSSFGSSGSEVSTLPSPNSASTEGMPSEADLESNEKLIKVAETLGLISKLSHHNDVSQGKFKHIIEFVKHEQEIHDQLLHHMASESSSFLRLPNRLLNEFITVDYSNYSISARSSH